MGDPPGKWLLKTKVKSVKGTKPTYEKAIHRAFSVWFRGIGMGIPVINIINMLVAYSRLKTRGITSWDREEKTKVTHAPMARFRLGIAIGIILISLIVNGYQKHRYETEIKPKVESRSPSRYNLKLVPPSGIGGTFDERGVFI